MKKNNKFISTKYSILAAYYTKFTSKTVVYNSKHVALNWSLET